MLPEKQRKTNVGVGVGFVLFVIGFILSHQEDPTGSIGFLLVLLSVGPFTWGCMNYAEGKGHSKWVGLVGVAGIIGLIVLMVLPDQHKNGR